MIHNGPYIAACAEKLGRELTKDEHIHALECLAHEAQEEAAKLRQALREVVDYRHGSMVRARKLLCVLDSQNS